MFAGFGKENIFSIEALFDDDSRITWKNGVLTNQAGEQHNIPLDDGSSALLDHFFSKWFHFESGFGEHDINVQQSYLKSLGLIEGLSDGR
jgi:hypothetical protein